MPSLPPEAIDALYPLTKDINEDVADAAKRAIKLHNPKEISTRIANVEIDKSREIRPDGIIMVLGSALITNLVFLILIRGLDSGEIWARFMIGALPSIVFCIVGYSVWLRSWRKREVEWDLKSALVSLIIIGFFAGVLPGFCAAIISN
jgi:hypothetical protein